MDIHSIGQRVRSARRGRPPALALMALLVATLLAACTATGGGTTGGATTTPAPTATSTPRPTPSPTTPSYAVHVYFSQHPASDDNPEAVFPVERVSPTLGVATYAVQQLLQGPTATERAAGYFTPFDKALTGDSNCDGRDFTITPNMRGTTPEAGTATLRFCRPVEIPGLLAGARMMAEINATMTQFPTIKRAVVLNYRGDCFNDLSGQNLCLAPSSTP